MAVLAEPGVLFNVCLVQPKQSSPCGCEQRCATLPVYHHPCQAGGPANDLTCDLGGVPFARTL